MTKRLRDKHGFTLMELMIVVAIAGILAAIAVPTFTLLANRSKSAEVSSNLNSMFKAAASYYSAERTPQGGAGQASNSVGFCTVGWMTGTIPTGGPTKNKQKINASTDPSLKALGWAVADAVYYAYELHSSAATATCGHLPNESSLYTFSAYGDLDSDSIWSTFEMAAGSNGDNVLYHGLGFYVVNELE